MVGKDDLRIVFIQCWSSIAKVQVYSLLSCELLPAFLSGLYLEFCEGTVILN